MQVITSERMWMVRKSSNALTSICIASILLVACSGPSSAHIEKAHQRLSTRVAKVCQAPLHPPSAFHASGKQLEARGTYKTSISPQSIVDYETNHVDLDLHGCIAYIADRKIGGRSTLEIYASAKQVRLYRRYVASFLEDSRMFSSVKVNPST